MSNIRTQKNKNLVQFWLDSIDNKQVLELLVPPVGRRRRCSSDTSHDNDSDAGDMRDLSRVADDAERAASNKLDDAQPSFTNNVNIYTNCNVTFNGDSNMCNSDSLSNSNNKNSDTTLMRRKTSLLSRNSSCDSSDSVTTRQLDKASVVAKRSDSSLVCTTNPSSEDDATKDIYERLKKVRQFIASYSILSILFHIIYIVYFHLYF